MNGSEFQEIWRTINAMAKEIEEMKEEIENLKSHVPIKMIDKYPIPGSDNISF